MSDTGVGRCPTAWIKETKQAGDKRIDTVDCPYCGEEHHHFGRGYTMAICQQGMYSVAVRLPGSGG